jgi:hypothetical protein
MRGMDRILITRLEQRLRELNSEIWTILGPLSERNRAKIRPSMSTG